MQLVLGVHKLNLLGYVSFFQLYIAVEATNSPKQEGPVNCGLRPGYSAFDMQSSK